MVAGVELTDEELSAAVALYAELRSYTACAERLRIDRKTFKYQLERAARRGLMGTKPVLPGFRIKKTSAQTDADGNLEREWVQQTPDLGEVFELPDRHLIKGVSALVDPGGNVLQKWVKTTADPNNSIELMRAVVDELKKEVPRVAPTEGPKNSNALLLNQYTVTDSHFGMLAWGEETRVADYDLKIAEKLLIDWFSAAIAMSPDAAVAVFAQLGDLMHHDALESVTPTHKHILDADSRLQKIIRVVIRVVRQIISMLLQKHPHVHIIMASANHDPASSAWMRELLHSMYEDEPRITVDNSPDVYYAYDWDNTALFYHHGHRRKLENVDSVFVGKFRELYGRAQYSYGHVGHLHSAAVKESNLMLIERHRTLAPVDSYAAGGGWLTKRDAKVISYHKQFGEVGRITISPQMIAGGQ